MSRCCASVRAADDLFAALARSSFRRGFRLRGRDLAYLQQHGLAQVMAHAAGIIAQRLAPAEIANDGKQTPFKGHPVFVAQHATACCCRGCLAKWHGIAAGHALTAEETAHVLGVLERWMACQVPEGLSLPAPVQKAQLDLDGF